MESTDVNRIGIQSAEDKLATVLGLPYLSYRDRWSNADRNSPDIIHLDIELVDSCNQRCIMCPRNREVHPQLDYTLETGSRLDIRVYERVLVDLIKLGLCSVNFGGFAEPFIVKNWDQFVTLSHSHGIIDTRLITNGLLLGQNINKVFESNLRNLYVSLDAASSQTYKQIRGHGFDRVVKSIDDVLRERSNRKSVLPIVRVSFVALAENEHEVQDFVNRWVGLVDHIDIQRKFDYASQVSEVEHRWSCDQPWKRLSLLANGDIIPCCSFNGRSLVLGNAKNESAATLWNGADLKEFREKLIKNEVHVCNICQSTVV
jgi:radical SAM protein with 4Fe4S-binding SPASM domain